MMSDNLNVEIGIQLKRARSKQGWSLDLTSKHTGVSKAMLGQIERGESSPTVARLWKIANGFHLPLSYFFGGIGHENAISKTLSSESGLLISTLFPFDHEMQSEVFSLTLAPLHQQCSAAHNDGVIEQIIVIEGEMEYFVDGQWHYLQEGDVVKFHANKEHGYRNLSTKQTIFHNIIYYTDSTKI